MRIRASSLGFTSANRSKKGPTTVEKLASVPPISTSGPTSKRRLASTSSSRVTVRSASMYLSGLSMTGCQSFSGPAMEATIRPGISRPLSGGYSRLIAQHSGKCLDVSGASPDDRAEIIQWQCHGGENQQWRVEAVTGGYQLVARHSGKCLDVRGESTNDGGSIIQWSCHSGANQTWLLRPVTTVPPPLP